MEKIDEILDQELIELEGFIVSYKFENEANGYRIASFKLDDNKQERTITIVGYFPHFNKTDGLIIKGNMINHKRYGLQLEVVEIYKKLPTSKENIIRFLSSSQFKGIGKKKAAEIYEYLKDDCISLMINNPILIEQMLENGLINDKQKESLEKGLRAYDFTSSAFQKLLKYGFSLKNIMKAEAVYGEDLDKIIEENPYQLIIDIDGIGFKSVDKMALNSGVEENDKRRVKAAILYCVINYCHQTGNTYLSLRQIYNNLIKLIKIDPNIFLDYINELLEEKYLVKEDDKIYHESLYNAEKDIAFKLYPFIKKNINKTFLSRHYDKMIKTIQEDEGITYSSEQIEAIYGALSNGLFIITGGPGTGKTTILNAILKLLKLVYGKDSIISLCAPTGRASKRMSLLSMTHATTIHRLLKWDLHSNTFAYNEFNKLHSDVIIIDEFSMVDTLLFDALLKGTCEVGQIILIGDDGQLPSVGAGNLLHDLLEISQIPHISLSHIYRQKNESSIVTLADRIRFNRLDESFKFENDISFIQAKNIQASTIIISLLDKLFEEGFSFDDVQIIIPMYGNVSGIDSINAAIQDYYNPRKKTLNEIKVGHQIFRENDRVLQLKNQPEDDIYNGDIGIIQEIDLENEEMVVLFDVGEVIYTKNTFSNLTLAYAISIHKSQGSEFDFVIMTIFDDYNFMLNKQLIYTGITRAKKFLTIIGNYQTFLKKSRIENKEKRKTSLTEKINKLL